MGASDKTSKRSSLARLRKGVVADPGFVVALAQATRPAVQGDAQSRRVGPLLLAMRVTEVHQARISAFQRTAAVFGDRGLHHISTRRKEG
jgi:hypothetical protein